ncbi:MAG: hypothetical protein ACLR23_03795 [Clostridia bacterium]
MPASRGSHEGSRRGEGKKRGQRRGLVQGKCPPVEGVTRWAAWRKGRKGARGEGRSKENARR